VREKWREKRNVSRPEVLHRFDPAVELTLRKQIAPFTNVHSDGLDGVFMDEEIIDELIGIITSFHPRTRTPKDSRDDAIQ